MFSGVKDVIDITDIIEILIIQIKSYKQNPIYLSNVSFNYYKYAKWVTYEKLDGFLPKQRISQ